MGTGSQASVLVAIALLLVANVCQACDFHSNCIESIVYVDETHSQGQEVSCGETNTYHTLKQAIDCTACCQFTTVKILGNITLNTTIYVDGRSNLTITGKGWNMTTYITCGWEFGLFNRSSHGAGFLLERTENFTIADLTLKSCGVVFSIKKKHVFRSAINMWACSNTMINNTQIISSNGIGIGMFSMQATTAIQNSIFLNNRVWKNFTTYKNATVHVHGGGGILIEQYNSTDNNHFLLFNCSFKHNRKYGKYGSIAAGGGLMLYLDGNINGTTINVTKSTFSHNRANWGGGLYIGIVKNSSNNCIHIMDTTMKNNRAYHGGGGICIGVSDFSNLYPSRNTTLTFKNLLIQDNTAWFGGGTAIAAKKHYQSDKLNSIYFINCTWLSNLADISAAAINVGPSSFNEGTGGLSFYLEYRDCKFINNSKTETYKNSTRFNFAIFVITSVETIFNGQILFSGNDGTALQINSANVLFKKYSKTVFMNNHSRNKGGAIGMIGITLFQFEKHCRFLFENNSAEMGGGIYYYKNDVHDYTLSYSCFIKCYRGGDSTSTRNTTFDFRNNKATSNIGNSIYVSTLKPCNHSCTRHDSYRKRTTAEDIFNSCVANFTFTPKQENQINTLSYKIFQHNRQMSAFPGQTIDLEPTVFDETNSNITKISIFKASGANSNDLFNVSNNFEYTTDGKITVLGKENSYRTILLQTTDLRKVHALYNITLRRCPPGYTINDKENRCICLAGKFHGLQCNPDKDDQTSLVSAATWIGYDKKGVLLTANCPVEYCINSKKDRHIMYSIPENLTNTFLCSHGCKGTLCGECIEGFSVWYHSEIYQCNKNTPGCTYGLLIYILTEILPVTLIFTFVIICNVSFTSGSLNGFILFAQVANIHSINSYYASSKILKYLLKGQSFFYGLFNLRLDGVEYCLWKGMTTLNVLAMKYVAILYSLGLILTLFVILNRCTWYRVLKLCTWQRGMFRSSVIHGISAFLVMCYSQCTRITFLILHPGELWMEGPKRYNETVVHMSGNFKFFGNDHLKYAIPALFFLLLFVIVPPVILLFNSIVTQVIRVFDKKGLHISARLTNKLLMISLKPLLDSFQGCFRDNCRCFAGVYFLYRAMLSYKFRLTDPLPFSIGDLTFIVILAIHAMSQPYKKKWHNTLDALLFTDLAIIKVLSIHAEYDYSGSVDNFFFQSLDALMWIQMVFLYIPILYVVVYGAYKMKNCCKRKKTENHEDDINEWPARLLRSNTDGQYGSFRTQ